MRFLMTVQFCRDKFNAAGGAGLLVGDERAAAAPAAQTQPSQPGGTFTFVHLTDQHVTNRRKGDEGYRRCIASINALGPVPDFVLMGGDMVFDGIYTPKA